MPATANPKATTPPVPCTRCGRLCGGLVNGRYEPAWSRSRRWNPGRVVCHACALAAEQGAAAEREMPELRPMLRPNEPEPLALAQSIRAGGA